MTIVENEKGKTHSREVTLLKISNFIFKDGVDLRSCRRSGDRTRLRIPTWVWQGTHPNIMAKRIISTPTNFQQKPELPRGNGISSQSQKISRETTRKNGINPTRMDWHWNLLPLPPACRVYLRLSVFDFWHVCHKATRECSVSLLRRCGSRTHPSWDDVKSIHGVRQTDVGISSAVADRHAWWHGVHRQSNATLLFRWFKGQMFYLWSWTQAGGVCG